MKIAFLMDCLESIDPEYETTSALMCEGNEIGHTFFFLEPHDVYIREDKVVARMYYITAPRGLSIRKYWRSGYFFCTSNYVLNNNQQLEITAKVTDKSIS
jgi:glutathione synthase